MAESQQEKYYRRLNEERDRAARKTAARERERAREEKKREEHTRSVEEGIYGPNSDL